jgi:hypothetical protein
VCNVNNFFEKISDLHECKEIDFTKHQQLTAKACVVGLRTVQRIWQEMRTEGCFVLSRKKNTESESVTKLDDFKKDIIRRAVHDMYETGEFPMAQKILKR